MLRVRTTTMWTRVGSEVPQIEGRVETQAGSSEGGGALEVKNNPGRLSREGCFPRTPDTTGKEPSSVTESLSLSEWQFPSL